VQIDEQNEAVAASTIHLYARDHPSARKMAKSGGSICPTQTLSTIYKRNRLRRRSSKLQAGRHFTHMLQSSHCISASMSARHPRKTRAIYGDLACRDWIRGPSPTDTPAAHIRTMTRHISRSVSSNAVRNRCSDGVRFEFRDAL
jgi:hypothetical protein